MFSDASSLQTSLRSGGYISALLPTRDPFLFASELLLVPTQNKTTTTTTRKVEFSVLVKESRTWTRERPNYRETLTPRLSLCLSLAEIERLLIQSLP